jgi:hypothetical protein
MTSLQKQFGLTTREVEDLLGEQEDELSDMRARNRKLLAALREVAAGRLDHEHGRDDYHDRVVALARAAIAKAEGES